LLGIDPASNGVADIHDIDKTYGRYGTPIGPFGI
jgi:3-hydroxyacyl-CoA dehydrogenase